MRLGDSDDLLTPHDLYAALGADAEARSEAYRALFRQVLEEEALTQIRAAWQTGTPLGKDRFRAEIERAVGRKVGYSRRGRPRTDPGRSSAAPVTDE